MGRKRQIQFSAQEMKQIMFILNIDENCTLFAKIYAKQPQTGVPLWHLCLYADWDVVQAGRNHLDPRHGCGIHICQASGRKVLLTM